MITETIDSKTVVVFPKHEAIKAKKAAAKAKKEEEMKTFEGYIKHTMNSMLREAAVEFEKRTEGSVDMVFKRNVEWDCEKFDGELQGVCEELETFLNDTFDNGSFTVEYTMNHDVCGTDGLSEEFDVEISWEMDVRNPFAEAMERVDGVYYY